jgi:UDP-N-acetylglucosamine 2-epimerase
MKIVTVIGARPQFIKALPVSRALQTAGIDEFLVHTGQHYDQNMSGIFFEELGLPEPKINLEVGSGPHGAQTATMLEKIERILLKEKPDWVIVYGDTNSTIAGALAAVKLHLPIAHVEAGLRSFNRRMPEEHNRVLTDHCSNLLLCPTPAAIENLKREGLQENVHLIGDVMFDSLLMFSETARSQPPLSTIKAEEQGYFIATIHRAENTDDPKRLEAIFAAFAQLQLPVFVPLHPRTRRIVNSLPSKLFDSERIHLIEPLGYMDMISATIRSRAVLTDSGGLQKESVWLGIPCVTLRDETEWIETLRDGYNRLAGASSARIIAACKELPPVRSPCHSGGGAAERCVQILSRTIVH